MIGRPLAEILGKTDRDLYPPELAAKYCRDDQRVITTGDVFDITETYQKADGQRGYVHVVKTPVRGAYCPVMRAARVGAQFCEW